MRKHIYPFLILSSTITSTALAHDQNDMAAAEVLISELATVGPTTFTSPDFKPGAIRHIVLFRYKDGTTEAEREEVRRRFTALVEESKLDGKPYIVSIESGAQMSGEGVDGGFEEAFLVTFRSEGERNYYVGTPIVTDPNFFDPAHHKFKEFVGPFLAENGVLVFDFAVSGKKTH